jgi:hypothetical protein
MASGGGTGRRPWWRVGPEPGAGEPVRGEGAARVPVDRDGDAWVRTDAPDDWDGRLWR